MKEKDGEMTNFEETYHIEEADEDKDDEVGEEEPTVMSHCYHLEEVKGHSDTDILIDTGSTVSVFKTRTY